MDLQWIPILCHLGISVTGDTLRMKTRMYSVSHETYLRGNTGIVYRYRVQVSYAWKRSYHSSVNLWLVCSLRHSNGEHVQFDTHSRGPGLPCNKALVPASGRSSVTLGSPVTACQNKKVVFFHRTLNNMTHIVVT